MTDILTPPAVADDVPSSADAPPKKQRNAQARAAWWFLAPNLLGFMIFLAGPLVFSLAMAFTNWDLRENVPLQFVGLRNFRDLYHSNDFWSYLINTLYFMLGIPLSIAGSLVLALALSKPLKENTVAGRFVHAGLVLLVSFVIAAGVYALDPRGLSTRVTAGIVLIGGCVWALSVFAGIVAYRTLFYLPSFTSGVASFILWKALYNTEYGPINSVLSWVFDALVSPANFIGKWWPTWRFLGAGVLVIGGLVAGMTTLATWAGGRATQVLLGLCAAVVATLVLVTGMPAWWAALICVLVIYLAADFTVRSFATELEPRTRVIVPVIATILTVCAVWHTVGAATAWVPQVGFTPLDPPQWLGDKRNLFAITPVTPGFDRAMFGLGAREALILMGIFTAIGGGNMLLYLAGLSNVPPELYEAADIDGASGWQRFWNVTWPQLAPTTFFITIMSIIGGFQGGFDIAKVMTNGGPAGTTTTLSYHIFSKAFEEFRFGYASAIAWVLFLIVFMVTLVNWRFGNKRVNE